MDRLSDSAASRRLPALGAQFTAVTEKASARSTISGCLPSTSSTRAASFLLASTRMTPCSRSRRALRCSWCSSYPGRARRAPRPSAPTSPSTPPHSVLSRSRASTLRDSPSLAWASRRTSRASTSKAPSV